MIDRRYLMDLTIPETELSFGTRDALLYALSIGLGTEPTLAAELPYVYERGLRVFPTMAVVISGKAAWLHDPAAGVNYKGIVHGSERLEVLGDLPPGEPLVLRERVLDVLDKGTSGAIIVAERTLSEKISGKPLARIETQYFCRFDGQFGGARGPAPVFRTVPAGTPDRSMPVPVEASRPLLYRLNGDDNPLHVDPEHARAAGFSGPILHGLCTFGIAAVTLWRDRPEASIRVFEARMASPVITPAELTVESWDAEDGAVAFRVREGRRVVLDRGRAVFEQAAG